jgi:hypothetical protein
MEYLPDGARKKINECLADGQERDTCVRALVTLTGANAETVQHVLGHMQSVNEIEIEGSYHGGDSEDHFAIRAIPRRQSE